VSRKKTNSNELGQVVKGKLVPMIGLAVVFGGLSIFAADKWVKSQTNAQTATTEPVQETTKPEIATTKIIVAKSALKYGTEVTADLVQEIDWPSNALPEGAITSLDQITKGAKRIVLSAISTNEPVVLAKLSGKDGRASLSNMLEPGQRAVTIRVDDITGVAGFVTPGDRVDVILTRQKVELSQPVQNEGDTAALPQPTSELSSETILQNVKVLTSDQSADQTSVAATVAKAVTVQVSSEDAQKVALAQQLGTLYLLLRSAGDEANASEASISASDLTGSKPKQVAAQVASPSILSLESEGPKFRSMIVTRGHVPETYSVMDEKGNKIKPVSGNN
jgi:pilus assembly protein CpaB